MPKQPRLMAEPIMCILCRQTENLVGHLYHWNNGDLQPMWEGALSTAKQKWARGQRKMLPLWGWDNHRIDERQHPGSRACHIAGGCPDALARKGQSVLIGV